MNGYYVNQSYENYDISVRICCAISGISCMFVLISFYKFESLRKASGHYSLWVALSNILISVFTFIDGPRGSLLCEITAFGRSYGSFVSLAVNLVLAIRIRSLFQSTEDSASLQANTRLTSIAHATRLFRSLSLQSRSNSNSTLVSNAKKRNLAIGKTELFCVWIFPIFLAWVPFLVNGYGKPEGGKWCWLNNNGWNDIPYLFLYYYIPLWLTIVITSLIYFDIYLFSRNEMLKVLNSTMTDRNSRNSSVYVQYKKLEILINKIKWYPFNMVACNIISTTIKILALGYHDSNVFMFFVGMVTLNLLGFVDSIAYMLTPSVQTAWLSWYEATVVDHPFLSVLCCNCCIFACPCKAYVSNWEVRSSNTNDTSRGTEMTQSRSTAGDLGHSSTSMSHSSLFSGASGRQSSRYSSGSSNSSRSSMEAHKLPPSATLNQQQLRPERISRSKPSIHAWNLLLINDIIEGDDDVDLIESDNTMEYTSEACEDIESENHVSTNSNSNADMITNNNGCLSGATVNQSNPILNNNNAV